MSWRRPRRPAVESAAAPQLTGNVVLSRLVWTRSGEPQLSLDCMLGTEPGQVEPVHLVTAVPETAWLLGGLLALLAQCREEGSEPDLVVTDRRVHLSFADSRFHLPRLAA